MDIPLVDLSDADAVDAIDTACCEVGFFRLVGHGLCDDDGASLIDAARQILAMTASQIDMMLVADDPNFRGFETAGERLAFEIGREGLSEGRQLYGPNRWPECDSSTRSTIERHYDRCTSIGDRLLALLIQAGRLGPEVEGREVTGGPAHLRLWRYPRGHIDLPPHADHGFLTLLVAPEVGLEVQAADGSFFSAPPAGGEELLVNVARLLAYASGDAYLPAVHRVRSDSDVERFSAPFFHAPADDLPRAPPADGSGEPRSVGDYIHWGYTWQHRVNAGASVSDATRGALEI